MIARQFVLCLVGLDSGGEVVEEFSHDVTHVVCSREITLDVFNAVTKSADLTVRLSATSVSILAPLSSYSTFVAMSVNY